MLECSSVSNDFTGINRSMDLRNAVTLNETQENLTIIIFPGDKAEPWLSWTK